MQSDRVLYHQGSYTHTAQPPTPSHTGTKKKEDRHTGTKPGTPLTSTQGVERGALTGTQGYTLRITPLAHYNVG
jgi:hypothetical protein